MNTYKTLREPQSSEANNIGLDFQQKKRNAVSFTLPKNSDDLESVLNEFVDKDSPHDPYLIPESQVMNRASGNPRGNAFQLKKIFYQESGVPLEEQLVSYLK